MTFIPIDISKLVISEYGEEYEIPELNITITVGLDGGDHLHLGIYPDNEKYWYHLRIFGMFLDYYHITNQFKLDKWINDCIKKGCINVNICGQIAEIIVWDETKNEVFTLHKRRIGDYL